MIATDRHDHSGLFFKLKISTMKKLMLLAGFYCLHFSLQAAPGVSITKYDIAPVSGNDRALAHFKENFAWVEDAAWYNTPDKNMYCVFHQGNIVNRVFYNERGYWQYTMISYPPANLPKSLRERVLDSFGGYSINYVNEVRSDKNEAVYMISIENKDNIKVIRVTDEDIEITQALKKR
jgi:hypothetical protein